MLARDWPDTTNAVNYTYIWQFCTVNYLVFNSRNSHANFNCNAQVIRFEIECGVRQEYIIINSLTAFCCSIICTTTLLLHSLIIYYVFVYCSEVFGIAYKSKLRKKKLFVLV